MKTMIIESELREQMAKAVRHGGHLSDLYSWLMARSLNVHKDSSPSAARLALELESLFFDRSDGELADIDLRRAITVLLNRNSAFRKQVGRK